MTTPNLRAAAQAALDALEQCGLDDSYRSYDKEANAAEMLRAALAQPEPAAANIGQIVAAMRADEPVAWIYEWNSVGGVHRALTPGPYNGMRPDRTIPVYASLPQRKPLPAEVVTQMWSDAVKRAHELGVSDVVLFAQDLQRAHGIR